MKNINPEFDCQRKVLKEVFRFFIMLRFEDCCGGLSIVFLLKIGYDGVVVIW
jgi:hypothetical protein